MGKPATAPCGHPGQVVIGTYVECSLKCGSGKPIAPRRRGQPGHVEMCACKHCQIRRTVTTFVFRSEDGNDIGVVAWDGIADRVPWTAKFTGYIRHWRMLDAAGTVLGEGAINEFATAGMTYDANVKFIVNGAALIVVTETPMTRGTRIHLEVEAREIKNHKLDMIEIMNQQFAAMIEDMQKKIAASLGLPAELLGVTNCRCELSDHELRVKISGRLNPRIDQVTITGVVGV